MFEPAPVAASMAIKKPRAIAGALVFEPERSGGWRARDFFVFPRGMAAPLLFLGPPGEKSLGRAVALKAIEAKPACGEIRPSEPRWAMDQHRRDEFGDPTHSPSGGDAGCREIDVALRQAPGQQARRTSDALCFVH